MEIGIMGGTFNPVHNGHIAICRNVMEKFKLDKVIFIPSFVSPHKKDMSIPEADMRLDMLKTVLEDEKAFEIDEFEINRKRISYSIDTIKYLKKKYDNDKIYWIIGTDMLFYLEEWYDHRKVLSEIGFIVILRDVHDDLWVKEYIKKLEKEYGAKIEICSMDNIDISSTMIRNKVKNGEDIKEYVHKSVEQYIIDNNLYKQ